MKRNSTPVPEDAYNKAIEALNRAYKGEYTLVEIIRESDHVDDDQLYSLCIKGKNQKYHVIKCFNASDGGLYGSVQQEFETPKKALMYMVENVTRIYGEIVVN